MVALLKISSELLAWAAGSPQRISSNLASCFDTEAIPRIGLVLCLQNLDLTIHASASEIYV